MGNSPAPLGLLQRIAKHTGRRFAFSEFEAKLDASWHQAVTFVRLTTLLTQIFVEKQNLP